MIKSRNKAVLVAISAVALALAVSLGVTLRGVTAVGSSQTFGKAVPLQGAAAARVELELDSGSLQVIPGRENQVLADGTFTYNVDAWKPDLTYHVISREGILHLEQGEPAGPFPIVYGDAENRWNVSLTPNVPLDLRVDLGSADGAFTLDGLDLIGLRIAGDGGNQVVNLGGPLPRDLDVRLSTGGGDLTLTVSTTVGVRVVVEGDDGIVAADGLRSTGNAFVNDLYGTTPLTLTVTIESDGGDVTLREATAASQTPFPVTVPEL